MALPSEHTNSNALLTSLVFINDKSDICLFAILFRRIRVGNHKKISKVEVANPGKTIHNLIVTMTVTRLRDEIM